MSRINKFKSPGNSRYLKGLFYEQVGADKGTVLYTLKDEDHLGFPSLYKKYMEAEDPTEYRFATENLDGVEHWEMLTSCSWFKPYVERWRRELELKITSEAIARISEIAYGDGKDSEILAANRYILDKVYQKTNPVARVARGRPSKKDKAEEAVQIAHEAKARIRADAERLFDKGETSGNA